MAQSNIQLDAITNDTTPPSSSDAGMLPTEAAYENLLSEILAVPESELSSVNIDLVQFDKLEQYTLALSHAHSRHRSTSPKATITDRVTDLTAVRDQLFASASSLASVRLIDGERLKNVKKANGYRALASDVLTLCTVLKGEWARIEGKTPFTQADLVRLSTLALEFVNLIGLREQAPVIAGEAALIRQKAFTLLLQAYDEARRGALSARQGWRWREHRALAVRGPERPPPHGGGRGSGAAHRRHDSER